MASALLPYVVLGRADGADVARRDDGEIASSHESLREALDAALAANGVAVSSGILRNEAGESIGAFRWLDSTAEEPKAAEDGSQVTRDLIAQMAANIDPASPVPMDGAEHGDAHQQLYDTSTRADGYVHAGIEGWAPPDRKWPDGRWHLYVYSELSPVAARDADLGLLVYGSIGFDQSAGRLLQHALTNVPAVEGLAPNNAIRAAGRISFRTQRIDMTTSQKTPLKTAPKSQRGPVADLIAEIAAKLGITLSPDEESYELSEKIRGSLWPLIDAAKVEKILEGGAPAPTDGEPVGLSADPAKASARALEGFADDAAQELWTSEVLAGMRDVFGQPEADPAGVLDMFKASMAAFKGAIATAPNPADSDAQATADAAALTASGDAAVRAIGSKLGELQKELAKRDLRDHVIARFRAADVSEPSSEELETLVADALKLDDAARSRFIDTACRARVSPPKGDVFGSRSTPNPGAPLNLDAEVEKRIPALRSAYPGEPKHALVSRALRAIEKEFPALS